MPVHVVILDEQPGAADRVRELLAEAGHRVVVASAGADPAMLCFGDVVADLARGRVLKRGRPVAVPLRELQLLRYLSERPGQVVSRDELLREVWDYQTSTTRTIDVHVASLRQKIEDNPHRPRHLLTIRGAGYVFRADPAAHV